MNCPRENGRRTVPVTAAAAFQVGMMVMLASAGGLMAPAGAQTTLGATRRAAQVVQRALEAMGGVQEVRSLGVVYREMQGVRTDAGQGPRPVSWQVLEPPPVNHPRVLVYSEPAAQRFVQILCDTILGGQPIAWWSSYQPAGGFFADAITRTMALRQPADLARTIPAALRTFPEGLLLAMWNRRGAARWIETVERHGVAYDGVTFADTDGAQVAVYFDTATGLPAWSETTATSPIFGDVTRERHFLHWRAAGNIVLPQRFEDRVNGVLLQRLEVGANRPSAWIPDSLLTPPGWPAPFNAGPAGTRVLAPGVAVITGGYNSLVVAFDSFLTVIEAGNAPAYAASVLEAARRAFPGRPIRYVVSTHFHHDHIGGARQVVAEGITILTTADAAQEIRQAALVEPTLWPDSLAQAPRKAKIEIVSGGRTISDGTTSLRIVDVGPNPHAEQMLVAYVPGARVLYQADMLDLALPDGARPTAGQDTRALAESLARLDWDIDIVVPAHGRIGTIQDLRSAIAP